MTRIQACKLIAKVGLEQGLNLEGYGLNTTFDSLKLDSLEFVNLCTRIEYYLEGEILLPVGKLTEKNTFGTLVEMLEKHNVRRDINLDEA